MYAEYKKCSDCKHVSELKTEFDVRWCFHPKFAVLNRVNNRMETSRRCDTERFTGSLCGREGMLFSKKKQMFWHKVKKMIFG